MCFICEMRRRAAEGNDEAELTLDAVQDPRLSAGMALMIGALMMKFGLDEFVLDPHTFDMDKMPAIAFERRGDLMVARSISADDLPAEVKWASESPYTVN